MGSITGTSVLQTPFTSPSLHKTFAHRIVLAPMTRMRSNDTTAVLNPTAAPYYAERTTPGALLISEGVVVHPRGKGFPRSPGIWTTEQAQAWKPVTDAVHAKGGIIFAQLWHVGRVSVPSQTGGLAPLSSTTAHLPGEHILFGGGGTEAYVPSHALTVAEIQEVVGQFAQAATLAVDVAGFDGVEIHGANGYLLDSFTHDNINTRTDEYGGPVANRLRFPLEVVDAVIGAVGKEKAAIRLAPYHVLQETSDSDRIGTFSVFCAELEKRSLGYVHFVEPRYDQLSTEGAFSGSIQRAASDDSPAEVPSAPAVPSLWPFRRILKTTTVIGAGGYDATSAAEALEEGRVDLVAFGRHFTSNPDLPERLIKGYPLVKYDRPTFYTPGEKGYLGWTRWDETAGNTE